MHFAGQMQATGSPAFRAAAGDLFKAVSDKYDRVYDQIKERKNEK